MWCRAIRKQAKLTIIVLPARALLSLALVLTNQRPSIDPRPTLAPPAGPLMKWKIGRTRPVGFALSGRLTRSLILLPTMPKPYDHQSIEQKWPSSAKATDGQAKMKKKYNHREIESKWQRYWLEQKTNKAEFPSAKPKCYCLIEFTYPSGDGLHVGHPPPYIGLDIIAR